MLSVDGEYQVDIDILPQVASEDSTRHRSDKRDSGTNHDENPFPTHTGLSV